MIRGLCLSNQCLILWRYEDDALIATPCPTYAK